MKPVVLSVCVICYNQADFIMQALGSVIEQKVNFSWEVIIADDCSTDGTREIVLDYKLRYPDLITILSRDKNIGAAKNFIELINAANGKYVAYLEGDDFWTMETKLQQQVDFLEQNPSFAICFTRCRETFSENINDLHNYTDNGSGEKTTTTINELIFRNYIQTCTVVFRNKLFGKFPDWYIDLKMGDWPLHLLNAQHGNIKYLPILTAVHRNHSSGVWSSRSALSKINQTITVYDSLEKHTDLYKLPNFKKAKSNLYLSSVKYHLREGNILKAFANFCKGFYIHPLPYKKPI